MSPENPNPNIFVVTLKLDKGGSALVLCKGMAQDPLFPEKVVLRDVQALSFPVRKRYLKTMEWSVPKDTVMQWKAGVLRKTFDITEEMLPGEKGQTVPRLPGTVPEGELITHEEEMESLVEQEEKPSRTPPALEVPPAPTPEPVQDPKVLLDPIDVAPVVIPTLPDSDPRFSPEALRDQGLIGNKKGRSKKKSADG